MCRKEFKFKRFQGTVDRVDIGGIRQASNILPKTVAICKLLFCSSAVLDPRVGYAMDVLSPFISVLSFSLTLPRGVLSTS